MDVAEKLHQILVECYGNIEQQQQQQQQQQQEVESSSSSSSLLLFEQENNQPSRKRPRLSLSEQRCTHNNTNPSSPSWKIPPTIHDTTISPLDYFLYHNKVPHSVNCSEHIDRGVLICVCLTSVPGLEVLCHNHHHGGDDNDGDNDNDSSSFVCPEVLTHNANLYQEPEPCSGLICIMVGDQLSQLLTGTKIQSCVHRVRNNLKRARLSISYELRV
jgi:hypothetical protein